MKNVPATPSGGSSATATNRPPGASSAAVRASRSPPTVSKTMSTGAVPQARSSVVEVSITSAAPSSRATSTPSPRAVATTIAPRDTASRVAMWPTPPAAPLISTRSPSARAPCVNSPCHAVRPGIGSAALSTCPSVLGFGATTIAGTAANSVATPSRSNGVRPKTSSPTASVVTREPIAATTADTSCEGTAGKRSVGQVSSSRVIAAACTRRSTSSARGAGTGSCSRRRSAGPAPGLCRRTARRVSGCICPPWIDEGTHLPRLRADAIPRRCWSRNVAVERATAGGIIRVMADTVVSSATREHVIGSGRPFTIIGERINPTGGKKLAAEMAAGDFSTVIADVDAQMRAGAQMLDVNAGIPLADEPGILAETVKLVQSLTDLPLSIDSAIVAALEAGLAAYQGKPLVTSVTGEDDRLEAVLPLVAKHGAAVVAITNDETGISEDPDVRFAIAEKIVHAAADHGIETHDVVVDPLVMPIGAMRTAGQQVFRLVRRLHDELGVNTTCGASNVSFGLPNRNGINGAFLSMAIACGMTSAITSPLHDEVKQATMAADVLMGNDAHAEAWIRRYADRAATGNAEGGGGRRRGGRAARVGQQSEG